MIDAGFAAFETSAVASAGHSPRPAVLSRGKRCLDVAVAGALLVFLLPIFLIIALAIKLDTPGPILFRQKRGGLRGAPFTVFKLRSMTVAEDGDHIVQAQRQDPRVTRVGGFLRRTSLDELPQLINVLRGEMSLVGPRPHALAHDRQFQTLVPSYYRRFEVKPGITGLAQIRGFRGEIRALHLLDQRTACDIEYVENWSLAADLVVLFATLKTPLDPNAH